MRDPRRFKDQLYEQFARIGKAVASPRRLEILDLLCQSEKSVEELAHLTRLNVKNASAHLRVLRWSRLVETRRAGKFVNYRLADEAVARYWLATRSLAERRLGEIKQTATAYFVEPMPAQRVDRRTLLERARRGNLILLDVRPANEYAAAHLPHARSLPVAELKRNLTTFPRDKEIFAYCRGPYCVLSLEAVKFLRRRGYRAIRLDDGVLEWQEAGLPIERLHKREMKAS